MYNRREFVDLFGMWGDALFHRVAAPLGPQFRGAVLVAAIQDGAYSVLKRLDHGRIWTIQGYVWDAAEHLN